MATAKCTWCGQDYKKKLIGDDGFCSPECSAEYGKELEYYRKVRHMNWGAWHIYLTKAAQEERLRKEREEEQRKQKAKEEAALKRKQTEAAKKEAAVAAEAAAKEQAAAALAEKQRKYTQTKQKADAFFAAEDYAGAVNLYVNIWKDILGAKNGITSAEEKAAAPFDVDENDLHQIRTNWAKCRLMNKDFDMAVNICDTELKLGPDAALYAIRGEAFHMKGNYEKAIADLNSAVKLDGENADYRAKLAAAKAAAEQAGAESAESLAKIQEGLKSLTEAAPESGCGGLADIGRSLSAMTEAAPVRTAPARAAPETGPEYRCCWCGNKLPEDREFCGEDCRRQFDGALELLREKKRQGEEKAADPRWRNLWNYNCCYCNKPFPMGMVISAWQALYCSEKCYRSAQNEHRQRHLQMWVE